MRYASTFRISRLNTGTVPPLREIGVGNFNVRVWTVTAILWGCLLSASALAWYGAWIAGTSATAWLRSVI